MSVGGIGSGGGFQNPYQSMGQTGSGAQGAAGASPNSSSPPTHKFKFAKIADVVNDPGDDK